MAVKQGEYAKENWEDRQNGTKHFTPFRFICSTGLGKKQRILFKFLIKIATYFCCF